MQPRDLLLGRHVQFECDPFEDCDEEREHKCNCRCKDKCAVPDKVVYIILTEKTFIDKLCVSRKCGLSKAEMRALWRFWWTKKHGCRTGDSGRQAYL